MHVIYFYFLRLSTTVMSSDDASHVSTVLEQYAAYPFESDDEFQEGLVNIIARGGLDGDPPPEIREEILRRIRVFYFNRVTGQDLSIDDARELEHKRGIHITEVEIVLESSPSEGLDLFLYSTAQEETPLTFEQLKSLLESGNLDEIPNNRVIPDDLNPEPPSVSSASARLKPWERQSQTTEVITAETGDQLQSPTM
ncbi:hypothetical protein FISHEDRAFT_40906 [Fistulina hepatica ATCC 64428]|uniref:Uncharacterized protein n=1 Tax=Fistulina hepatica ATCC 64428 TaxID=1128425 RepID=A0A0D7AHR5_9AGAR|nr:hypothetical protein FISHEDRAFT_40906 [Fistulina hepatica ATCC 64428]